MKNLIVDENKLSPASGKGAGAGIEFPNPAGHEAHQDDTQLQVANNSPKLIFIVEDNIMYAKSLQYYLADRFPGSKIRICSQGESCIDNLDLDPDYIIMDHFLNSKEYNAADGLQTIREIRKKNINSRIIVLSSQQNMDVTVEAVEDHHCSYVVKNEAAFEKVYNMMKEKK